MFRHHLYQSSFSRLRLRLPRSGGPFVFTKVLVGLGRPWLHVRPDCFANLVVLKKPTNLLVDLTVYMNATSASNPRLNLPSPWLSRLIQPALIRSDPIPSRSVRPCPKTRPFSRMRVSRTWMRRAWFPSST